MMNHYPPNRMINYQIVCSFFSFPLPGIMFDEKKNTLFRFIIAKSSSIRVKFDEFKLLTRKSCFFLAGNKSFSIFFPPKRFLLNLMDDFVCSPFWLCSWCNSCRGKSCLINILSASFPSEEGFSEMSKKYWKTIINFMKNLFYEKSFLLVAVHPNNNWNFFGLFMKSTRNYHLRPHKRLFYSYANYDDASFSHKI